MNKKQFIEKNIDEMTHKLIDFVNIPSVLDPNTANSKGAPFGQDIQAALEYILKLGESFGMKTRNFDGYAGDITVGKGSFIIGILGHVDVVSAGKGWNTDPFNAVIIDEEIFGRGTADDKGPILSSLYSMKYMVDNNLIPEGVSIRMILGTDEEEEWRGIDKYIEKVDILPNLSFVPDGYFPLVNCEKGLLDFNLIWEEGAPSIETLNGGDGRNIVPSETLCTLNETFEIIPDNLPDHISLSVIDGKLSISAKGLSTHAMSPEKGKNAISMLFDFLNVNGIKDPLVTAYNQLIGMGYNGENMNINFSDDLSGILTFNVGKVAMENEKIIFECNVRYPASMELTQIEESICNSLSSSSFQYSQKSKLPPICISQDTNLVSALLESYREVTGDTKNTAFAIGGATYARAIPNAVSFGPLFPYEEELAHEANEKLSIDSYKKMTEIYISALEKLVNTKGA